MARRSFTTVSWDQLLDGTIHLVDLDAIGYDGAIPNFVALVHYQAAQRRGTAKTRRLGPVTLTVQSFDCRPRANVQSFLPPQPPVRSEHVLDPADYMLDFDEDEEREAERLLGPCTCGKAPYCLPSCARA